MHGVHLRDRCSRVEEGLIVSIVRSIVQEIVRAISQSIEAPFGAVLLVPANAITTNSSDPIVLTSDSSYITLG